jgi:hypothetical protein
MTVVVYEEGNDIPKNFSVFRSKSVMYMRITRTHVTKNASIISIFFHPTALMPANVMTPQMPYLVRLPIYIIRHKLILQSYR